MALIACPVAASLMDYAVPRADEVPAIAFETRNVRCMHNPLGVKGAGEAGAIGKLDEFRDLLPPVGFVAIPADQAGPFLNGHAGSAWMTKTTHTRLVLAEMENKACSLFAPDVGAAAEETLFLQNANSKPIHTERIGSQVEHMFAVTQRDPEGGPHIRVVAILAYSSLASVTGITMTAVPASEFPGHESEWPTLPGD